MHSRGVALSCAFRGIPHSVGVGPRSERYIIYGSIFFFHINILSSTCNVERGLTTAMSRYVV